MARKFVPKSEICSQYYKIWQSKQVKFVIHKHDIWNYGPWREIKNFGIFGLSIAMYPIFIEFGTHNKSNMLVMNIILASVYSACVIINPEWL